MLLAPEHLERKQELCTIRAETDIEVYLLPNPLSGSVLPKNGMTSLHAKRKGWVGMSSPSVITANLWLACEKRVILIEVLGTAL